MESLEGLAEEFRCYSGKQKPFFFLQVFEQEREMIGTVLQGSGSFRDERELIVQCFSNSGGI